MRFALSARFVVADVLARGALAGAVGAGRAGAAVAPAGATDRTVKGEVHALAAALGLAHGAGDDTRAGDADPAALAARARPPQTGRGVPPQAIGTFRWLTRALECLIMLTR